MGMTAEQFEDLSPQERYRAIKRGMRLLANIDPDDESRDAELENLAGGLNPGNEGDNGGSGKERYRRIKGNR